MPEWGLFLLLCIDSVVVGASLAYVGKADPLRVRVRGWVGVVLGLAALALHLYLMYGVPR